MIHQTMGTTVISHQKNGKNSVMNGVVKLRVQNMVIVLNVRIQRKDGTKNDLPLHAAPDNLRHRCVHREAEYEDMTNVMFSSKTDLWETPQAFFDELDKEFNFQLDVCATPENAKCENFYTKKVDGLMQNWGGQGTIWCNPPYGREIGKWVQKAYETSQQGETVVMLLPARTDTRWFHDYIKDKAEIRFVKGRLKFGNSKNSAPFPSMVVIYNGRLST